MEIQPEAAFLAKVVFWIGCAGGVENPAGESADAAGTWAPRLAAGPNERHRPEGGVGAGSVFWPGGWPLWAAELPFCPETPRTLLWTWVRRP